MIYELKMDLKILLRYFSNKYSRKDFSAVNNAFQQKGENPQLEEQMNLHWQDFDSEALPDIKLDHLLDKVHHRMNVEGNPQIKVFNLWQLAQRAAAILFLPLLLGSLAYNYLKPTLANVDEAWAEIQCPLGVRTKFQLPDGSTGFLNSGSVLKYPVIFANNRNVKLTGEGYFEVVHNEKSPFHVKTKNLDVKVLGTTFNIVAYENENLEEVILQTGHVEVASNDGKSLGSLQPEQEMVFNKQDLSHKINNVESTQYTSWKEGRLTLRNVDIDELAIRLSRWYNAEVIVDKTNKAINAYAYHGTFEDEQLDDVLKILSLSSPISYIEKERTKDKSENYSKRKVILSVNLKKSIK